MNCAHDAPKNQRTKRKYKWIRGDGKAIESYKQPEKNEEKDAQTHLQIEWKTKISIWDTLNPNH